MGEIIRHTFKKSERLTNVKLIDSVFRSSDTIKAFPVIFIYKAFDLKGPSPFQVLFSVSKKKFRHAVDRNRIKRLMRESFRLQKSEFISALGERRIIGAFIYTNKDITDYASVSLSMSKLILNLKGTASDENLKTDI